MDQKLCVVCGAISKIKVFGVNVCKACKSFYRCWKREGQYKNLECAKNQSCEITEITRSCSFCRWKKWQEKVRPTENNYLQALCSVCGSIILLHHPSETNYCFACREFFTKNDGIVLHCVKGNNRCEISRNNQKKCGYCRMKKCLEAGMKATEIALDQEELEQDQKSEKITQIIEEFKANHSLVGHQHFEGVPISLFITQPSISPLIHRLNAWQIYSSHMDQEILKIIYFSKSILSLDQITIQDQLGLTKKSIFKMYLLHVVPVISLKGLVLQNGRIIDFKSLELLFGNQLAKKILEFSEDVKNLSFHKENLIHVLAFILMPKSQEVKNLISGTIGDLIYIRTKLEYLDKIFRGSVVPWLRENQKWMKLPEIFREIFEI